SGDGAAIVGDEVASLVWVGHSRAHAPPEQVQVELFALAFFGEQTVELDDGVGVGGGGGSHGPRHGCSASHDSVSWPQVLSAVRAPLSRSFAPRHEASRRTGALRCAACMDRAKYIRAIP